MPDLTEGEIANTDFGAYSAAEYLDDLGRVTQYYCDPDLAETLVNHSTDTVQWLHGRGVRFVPRFGRYAFKHEGRFKFFGGTVVEAVGGGRGLVESEYKAVVKHGIDIRYGTQARALVHEKGRVTGVRVVTDGAEAVLTARAVVLACGGFEANREMRTRYPRAGLGHGQGARVPLQHRRRYSHGPGCGRTAVRAVVGLSFRVVGTLCAGFWRYRYTHGVQPQRLPLQPHDQCGRQAICRRGGGFSQLHLRQVRALGAATAGEFCVAMCFDSQVAHLLHDEYKSRGATKVQADTIEELAARMEDVNAPQFLQTVREYNAAVKCDVAFDPNVKDGRALRRALPSTNRIGRMRLEKPPYLAYAVTCGITFTFGGLKINPGTQVLDIDDAPLPWFIRGG